MFGILISTVKRQREEKKGFFKEKVLNWNLVTKTCLLRPVLGVLCRVRPGPAN